LPEFTGDDVRVNFGRAGNVASLTGLIPTGALDKAVQLYFDQRCAEGLFREGRVNPLDR
jgi:hypothetical protein